MAERGSNHKAHFLEKDIWVVATLGVLFDGPFARHLTFKGGTSLSKVWRAIRRFSEDVDITYDIRAFAPDLVSGAGDEALPPTRSQEKRWTRAIRPRLTEWVRDQAHPVVEAGLSRAGFGSSISCRRGPPLRFLRVAVQGDWVGAPRGHGRVWCALHGRTAHESSGCLRRRGAFPGSGVSRGESAVMVAERTFWEKATAIHVFCRQERRRGERLSRHWHDLARLDEVGIAARALADRALALSVARHKAMFFSENDATGSRIEYEAAVSGDLQLVPAGAAHAVLTDDYARMLADGMLVDDAEPFDVLMERCAAIEARANAVGSRSR